ncbi:hypothetical protein AB0A69_11845 [Streptomyces sp. NPDC045431]|uniref:hypothetical protein n=1 Tax=Streptomyces sp. NPDC045431 TaxID=3155613 RepID=UPI0033E9726C
MDIAVIAATASTALVGAMATDAWGQAVRGMTTLWQRVHPGRAEAVGEDLAEDRRLVLAAHESGDEEALRRLRAEWESRLHRLLSSGGEEVADELRRLVADQLLPHLPAGQRAQYVEMYAEARDNGRINQAVNNQINFG